MDYRINKNGNEAEIQLTGRFTFDDHERFRELLDAFKNAGASRCVLDMERLEFIDSAGLGMLLLAREAASKTGTNLSLRAGDGQVRRMLEVSKFDSLIPFA